MKLKADNRSDIKIASITCFSYTEEVDWFYNPDGDACNCNGDEYYAYTVTEYHSFCYISWEEYLLPVDQGGGGGGGIAGSIAAESQFGLTDNDPDIYWWNDQTTTYPSQSLSSWASMNANYPKDANGDDLPGPQVYSLVGGDVVALYNSNPTAYQNACALRVSRALNYSGVTIPNISGHTFKGADNKYYFLSSAKLYNWMIKTFGAGDITLTKAQGGAGGSNFSSQLAGNKGMYILQVLYPSQFGALGHATLFDGSTCISDHCFFDAIGGVEKIVLWKLN